MGEASLDVEWAHAIAPGASIVVYNAAYDPNDATTSFVNLLDGDAASLEASGRLGRHPELWRARVGRSPRRGLNEKQIDSDFTTPGVTFLAVVGRFRNLRQRRLPGRRELSGRLAQHRLRRRHVDRDRRGRRLPGDRPLGRGRLG